MAVITARKKLPFERSVNGRYGAPFGRSGQRFDDCEKVRLRRVPINSGGYDPGGAYWGLGGPLWCAWTESGGVLYTRARDRAEAKEKLESNPLFADGCTWLR